MNSGEVSTAEVQISQLEAAIAAQETLRPTIGDAAVEASIAALRAQIAALRAPHQAEALSPGQVTPNQLLERLRSYLPQGLADKMRAIGHVEGERKQATVVFADLSGFTALGERLDPEEVTMPTNEVVKEVERLVDELDGADQAGGDDRLRRARIHFWMGRLHYYLGAMGTALGYYQQVLTAGKDAGDEELLAIPAGVIGRVLLARGQFGQAAPLPARAAAFLEKAADRTEWVYTFGFLGASRSLCGRYTEGVSQMEHALAQAREMNYPAGIAANHLFLCIACLMGGEPARALEESRGAVQAGTQSRDWINVYSGHGWGAWAQSRLGNHAAAVESMARARTVGQELGQRLLFADVSAAAEAEIAFNAGRLDEAITLAKNALPTATATGCISAEGIAHRVWGQALAGRPERQWDEVETHLVQSLRLFEAGEARLEAARTHVIWGSICHDHGDLGAARDHWEKAAAQWEASGITWELEKVRLLLASLPTDHARG